MNPHRKAQLEAVGVRVAIGLAVIVTALAVVGFIVLGVQGWG